MNTATLILHGVPASIRLHQLEAILRIRVAEQTELELDPTNVIVHFSAPGVETRNVTCLVLLHLDVQVPATTSEKLKSKISLCVENFLKPKPRFVQVILQQVESADYYFSF